MTPTECGSSFGKRRGHGVQPAPYGGIDHLVADHDARAADQLGVDFNLRGDLAAELLLERREQRFNLLVRHRERRDYRGLEHAFVLALEFLEVSSQLRDELEAP